MPGIFFSGTVPILFGVTPKPCPVVPGMGIPAPLEVLPCSVEGEIYPGLYAGNPCAALEAASSSPVAITVIVQVSALLASYIAPKMIFTSSPARF